MTEPSTQAQAAALAQAYAQQTAATRTHVLELLGASWLGLAAWRDADVARFLQSALPLVAGAQRMMGTLTGAYLTSVVGLLTGHPGIPAPAGSLTNPRGVPPAEVYRRPFIETWTALSNGTSLEQAVRQGQNRLHNLAATDLQLAKTHATTATLARNPRVSGYRRVPDAKACALCLLASTQRYHKADLMPIHPGCGCDVEPLTGSEPAGQVIDRELANRLHNAVRDQFGAQSFSGQGIGTTGLMYRDLIVTHQHGEIGPVLAVRGQHFDGPSAIPAA